MDPRNIDVSRPGKKSKKVNDRKELWIIAGRDQFAKYGLKGINIDHLSKKVGISRTSFYHFFKNKDQFLHEMVDYWIEDGTMQVINTIKNIKDPDKRMVKMYNMALHNDINEKFLSQMRNVAPKNSYLKSRMNEAEELRLKTITKLFTDLGLTDKESDKRAKMIYFLFLGFLEYNKTDGYTEEAIQDFIDAVTSVFLK